MVSEIPVTKIRKTFTPRQMPVKNQIERCPPDFIRFLLPEDDLQNDEDYEDHSAPEQGAVEYGLVLGFRNWRKPINYIFQFRFRLRRGQITDDHSDNDTNQAAPKGAKHVLRLILRVHRERHVTYGVGIELHPGVHADGRQSSRKQSRPAARRSSAFPQHAEDHGAKERCDEEAKE